MADSFDPRVRGQPDGGSWRERLEAGRVAFNRGDFFEAHELWEDVWRVTAGAERDPVQSLIQIAAALHHLRGGRPAPAARLLARGLEKLSRSGPLPGNDLPIEALAEQVRGLIAALAIAPAGSPPDPHTIKF